MEWLQQVFDRFLSVFPRIQLIPPNQSAVRVTFGKHVKVLNPGWYIYWPLIQIVDWAIIKTQVVDLRAQSVGTKDKKSIVVSGAIQYSIRDIKRALLEVQDYDKSLETLALGIIFEFVSNKRFDECLNIEQLKSEILKGVREAAQGWGIKIERVYITDLDKVKNIRLLSNGTTLETALKERMC